MEALIRYAVTAVVLILTCLIFVMPAAAEKRVALVVGNANYRHAGKLTNPRNDAVDVAKALRSLKIHVVEGFDLGKSAMEMKLREFANKLAKADVGIFFYAGHGLQVNGVNYLVPVDAQLLTLAALDFEMVRLDLVQRSMESVTKTNILFFDACRNNPLVRNLARALGTRSMEIGRGLAPVEAGLGTLISFSTQPGNVASDGSGRNSPYTGPLVKRLPTLDEDVLSTLTFVRNEVVVATSEKQVPWDNNALRSKFYFNSLKPTDGVSPNGAGTHPGRKEDQRTKSPFTPFDACEQSNNIELAITGCTEYLRANPKYVAAYNNRGNAYRKKSDFDHAIADHNEAIRLNPNSAESYVQRANAYDDKGEKSLAIADYNEAIRLNPKSAYAYLNRGISYRSTRDYNRAIADFDEAVRLHPTYADAFDARGIAYHDMKEFDRAIADYDQAIRLKPNLPYAYNDRGIAYNSKGEYDRAIVDFDAAIGLDPNYAEAFSSRGTARWHKMEFDEAIADYDVAIRLNTKAAYIYSNRGIAYNSKGEYDRAIVDFDAAIGLDARYVDAFVNRAHAYKRKGDNGRAIVDLDEAIRLNPKHVNAYNSRGEVHEILGEINKAVTDYKIVLSLDPENPTAKDALQRLGVTP